RVEAWLLRARVDPDARAPAVIMFHGNAELIDECTGDAARWNIRGRHVLLCEYHGYGRSTGHPSQRAIVGDGVGEAAAEPVEVAREHGVEADGEVVAVDEEGGAAEGAVPVDDDDPVAGEVAVEDGAGDALAVRREVPVGGPTGGE